MHQSSPTGYFGGLLRCRQRRIRVISADIIRAESERYYAAEICVVECFRVRHYVSAIDGNYRAKSVR